MKRLLQTVLGWMFPSYGPYVIFINEHARDQREHGDTRRWWQLVYVRWSIMHLPRVMLWCRVVGHRPVVDGCQPSRGSAGQYPFWVCCARCGVRSYPSGALNPDNFRIGQRYDGPWDYRTRGEIEAVKAAPPSGRGHLSRPRFTWPGLIEDRPEGTVGAELVIGAPFSMWGINFKVGHASSEQTLAFSLQLGRLLHLYLHTAGYGTWLQRRLNPSGYVSRHTGIKAGRHYGIEWKVWAPRDESSPAHPVTDVLGRWLIPRARRHRGQDTGPWWRHGAVRFNWADNLLGMKLYDHTDVMGPLPRVVRMPERDYLVNLTLQRQTLARRRDRAYTPQWATRAAHTLLATRWWPVRKAWLVSWDAIGSGIPCRHDDGWKGPVTGSAVTVSAASVTAGTWAGEAVAAIALSMAQSRTRYRFEPTGRTPVDEQVLAVAR